MVCETESKRSTEIGVMFKEHPLILFLIIGIVGRLVCAPLLTYDFDMYHWAVIMQNINSGNGLYELTGYFYTPVWGYIMAFIDMIWNTVMSIDVFGQTVTGLFGIEDMDHIYHISTITSPAFNTAMKIPLILCDVIVGYILYLLVKEFTDDRKKAEYAFGLWFLCPIVFYMSGIQGMFDCVTALLTILCFFFAVKERYFLAGTFLTLATLLKLFPGTCVIILVIYVFKRYAPEDGRYTKLFLAIAGAVAALIIVMIPNIMSGNLEYTLTLITDRSDRSGIAGLALYLLAGILVIFFAYRFSKQSKEGIELKLMKYAMYTLVSSMMFAYAPQYVIVALPFVIFCLFSDRGIRLSWWLIGIGAFVSALALNNFSLLCSVSAFNGMIPEDWIVSMMHAFETKFLGISWEFLFNAIGFMMEYAGLLIILAIAVEHPAVKKFPKMSRFYSKIRGGAADENGQ